MFWPSALFPFAKIDFQESGRAAERWVTPGSRLFVAGFGHTRNKINIAKVMGHAIKRLPAMGIVKLPENVAAKFSLSYATLVASSWGL